jgi:cytochrome c5
MKRRMKRGMKRGLFVAMLAAGLGCVAAQAENVPITLKSVSVDLPDSDRAIPDGPGADALRNNCVSCHSAGMILNQPTMAKAAWAAEVAKMRNVYKAPVDEKDVPDIVGYLAAVKGPK